VARVVTVAAHVKNGFDVYGANVVFSLLLTLTWTEDAVDVVGLFMSPSRTPRYALTDVTQQQNVAPPVLTNTAGGGFDHTTLLMDETEAFALEPIDVTAIGEHFASIDQQPINMAFYSTFCKTLAEVLYSMQYVQRKEKNKRINNKAT